MTLEDRFRSFASEQKAPADQHHDPYERDVESMKKVDSIVSRVLEAFCHAVGWSLKRSDCCDRDKGAVSCNYILEHRDFWREGYVTVDVEVTRGYRSDPVEAVTVYQGSNRGDYRPRTRFRIESRHTFRRIDGGGAGHRTGTAISQSYQAHYPP